MFSRFIPLFVVIDNKAIGNHIGIIYGTTPFLFLFTQFE